MSISLFLCWDFVWYEAVFVMFLGAQSKREGGREGWGEYGGWYLRGTEEQKKD